MSGFVRTKSLLRKWKIQVWAVGMEMCYCWNYMPHNKSNEAELNLFLSTEETAPTGWHLVTGMFMPSTSLVQLHSFKKWQLRKIQEKSSFPHIYLLKYLQADRLFIIRNVRMYFRGVSVACMYQTATQGVST